LLILEQIDHPAIPELVPYLTGGFGDGTRMDYGSGHELSFVAWLCCIDLLGLIKKEDYCVVVLVIFTRYLSMVRKLQKTYNLEPAGSHGMRF
jgi:serine/threonine-protein phosphatase 2A activator